MSHSPAVSGESCDESDARSQRRFHDCNSQKKISALTEINKNPPYFRLYKYTQSIKELKKYISVKNKKNALKKNQSQI